MDNIDTQELTEHDEEHMFLRDVIGDEHELLYLDSYLRDVFGGAGAARLGALKGGLGAELGAGGLGLADEEETL
jgi:hypothetical protein